MGMGLINNIIDILLNSEYILMKIFIKLINNFIETPKKSLFNDILLY